jgi:hypothetical protein
LNNAGLIINSLALLAKNKRCLFYFSFAAPAPMTAKLHFLPDFFPFFAPRKSYKNPFRGFFVSIERHFADRADDETDQRRIATKMGDRAKNSQILFATA